MKGRKWVVVTHFHGAPKDGDLKLIEFELPDVKDGEILLEAVYLTVNPYMRVYNVTLKIGDKMMGEQVAKVVTSKSKDFSPGDYVLCNEGWTTHSVVASSSKLKKLDYPPDVPLSLALGILGMTGVTAYYGLIEITNPKAGETILVNGASGATGSAVGQIAKILGCRVIGFAGSDEKVEYLKDLGFDVVINYRKVTDLDATIKSAAPKGVDVFFDNVGGEFFATVIPNMAYYGRVCVVGSISVYNAENDVKVTNVTHHIHLKRLKIHGFLVFDYAKKYDVAIKHNMEWIKQGKLKYREHVTDGFENMYEAFQELFTGANMGKAIVKV